MSYALLNLLVLLGVLLLTVVLTIATPRGQRASVRALLLAMLALLLLTAVFDNLMIAVGLVDYQAAHISGVMIGLAPIEDFGYSIAVALLAPTLWHLLASRKQAA